MKSALFFQLTAVLAGCGGEGGPTGDAVSNLTWSGFLLDNLLPVTLGNLIGGGLLVGAVYWLVYLRGQRDDDAAARKPVRLPVADRRSARWRMRRRSAPARR